MKIAARKTIFNPESVLNAEVTLASASDKTFTLPDKFAYPPLLNSHDHLIGNWVPRAANKRPYVNSHIWVEDMKYTPPFLERNKVWINDGSFKLMNGNAPLIIKLGVFKNVFSGVSTVFDHCPNQVDEYYDIYPINILKDYRQVHSITLDNWWGGLTPHEEMEASKGVMPFVIHIGEGLDEQTKNEFNVLCHKDLLQPNSLLIHCVSFTEEEIIRVAEAGSSICWCPGSNYFLLDKTLNIEACLKHGVNVVIGTDSTMSGSPNLFAEMKEARDHLPNLDGKKIYEMVSTNAAKAMFLKHNEGQLSEKTDEILLLDAKLDDPFENIIQADMAMISLFVYRGRPLYGDYEFLSEFDVNTSEYEIFNIDGREKFIFGCPQEVLKKINSYLNYNKDFPYLPF